MKAKNCLIFGGSGQIGRNLIRKLTKNNYRVTVVTRNIHQKSYIIKTQANAGYIEIVEANIFEENAYTQEIETKIKEIDEENKIIELEDTIFYGKSGGQQGDEGEIIAQYEIEVDSNETLNSLKKKISREELLNYPKIISSFLNE